MATLRLSTALRNSLLGYRRAFVGITYALVNSTSRLTASGNNLITDEMHPGDVPVISGSGASNDGPIEIVSVASDGSYAVLNTAPTDESANANLTITLPGRGLAQALQYGFIGLYGGTMPANADTVEGSSMLVKITLSSGALTAGTLTNGLTFGTPAAGVMAKSGVWSGVGIVAGTITWGRFYSNASQIGADSNEKMLRFDGNAGTSGAVFQLTSTAVAVGQTITVDTFNFTQLGA